MKTLVTGANGFIGSHLLDEMQQQERDVSILLRTTSNTSFIEQHLNHVEVNFGSLSDPDSLQDALDGVETVIHCAGKTKAVKAGTYYAVNGGGTQRLVEAVNDHSSTIKHFVLVSSVSAAGPGTAERPVREDDIPHPVSHYGRSKLQGELAVRADCEVPWTILRPAIVYGPRESDLYLLFKQVNRGFMPLIGGGAMQVSAVYVADLVEAILRVTGKQEYNGRTYHVASPHSKTMEQFLETLADVMEVDPWRIPVPLWALYPVCIAQELWARVTSRPSMLNLQKIREYEAPGWVCSVDKIREEVEFETATPLAEGIERTFHWYEENDWL